MALQQSREKAKREVAAIKKKNINKLIRNYIIETTPEIDAKSVIENAVIERRDFEAAKTPLMRPRGLRLAGILTGSIAFYSRSPRCFFRCYGASSLPIMTPMSSA